MLSRGVQGCRYSADVLNPTEAAVSYGPPSQFDQDQSLPTALRRRAGEHVQPENAAPKPPQVARTPMRTPTQMTWDSGLAWRKAARDSSGLERSPDSPTAKGRSGWSCARAAISGGFDQLVVGDLFQGLTGSHLAGHLETDVDPHRGSGSLPFPTRPPWMPPPGYADGLLIHVAVPFPLDSQ